MSSRFARPCLRLGCTTNAAAFKRWPSQPASSLAPPTGGTPLPPPPAVVAPPPPPASFFKRLARALTSQAKREQQAAQAENERRAAEHAQAVAAARATGLPIEEMTGRLAEATTVDDNDLRALAQARAQQVRDYFATVGKIPADRLFLANPATATAADATNAGKGPRVFLQLQ